MVQPTRRTVTPARYDIVEEGTVIRLSRRT